MIVTFCGHRDAFDETRVGAELADIVATLVAQGADTFYLGGYGRFDTLAALAVRRVQTGGAGLRSVVVLPYPDRRVDASLYNESIYPALEGVPRRLAILKRNEWMVEQADIVVAHVTRGWGGAAQMLDYAIRCGKTVYRIGEEPR